MRFKIIKLFFILFGTNVFATNYYVAPGGSGSGSGLDASNKSATIQNVLTTYNLGSGDIINVDAGTYAEKNIVIGSDDEGFTIQGAALDANGLPTSVFDSNQTDDWLKSTRGENDNITISNIYVKDYKDAGTTDGGGFIKVNTANGSGGDFGNTGWVVSNCFIDNCDGSSTGGTNGGAVMFTPYGPSSITFNDVTITNSSAPARGGAIYFASNNNTGTLTLNRCKFYLNTAGTDGSAVFLKTTSASSSTFTNCLFYSNTCTAGIGSIYLEDTPMALNIMNCTVANNSASSTCGGIYQWRSGSTPTVNIDNSIIYGNSIKDVVRTGGVCTIDNSCYGSHTGYTVTNCITSNPMFAYPSGGYYYLSTTSPCIDYGNATGAPLIDINSFTRSALPDAGCYESGEMNGVACPAYTGTMTVGPSSATFTNLSDAIAKLSACDYVGNIILELQTGYDGSAEPFYPITFASSLPSASNKTITIQPNVAATMRTITATKAGSSVVLFDDGQYITFNGATGGGITITNTSTSNTAGTSTITFINDANNNSISGCTVKGSETNTTSGVIFFSTATTAGNDNNTITGCNITQEGTNRPVYCVYSLGSASFENSANTISNNNFYDHLIKGATSSGAILISTNNDNWTISGNSFYETASFVPTSSGDHTIIAITDGDNNSITGNYIGSTADNCSGSAWSKTNASSNGFVGISLNVGTTTATNVDNNTIKKISYSNSNAASDNFTAIEILGGNVNVGLTTANNIGDPAVNGSLSLTSNSSGRFLYGINVSSGGNVDIQNNIIAGLTTSNGATFDASIIGINKSVSAGSLTISNNVIGNTSTVSNSLYATSASSANNQTVFGIKSSGTGTITISGNTIDGLTNATTNTSSINFVSGIGVLDGTATISSNTVKNLTSANANTVVSSTQLSSVIGICAYKAAVVNFNVTQNTIFNLSNSASGAAAQTSVKGMYIATGGTNTIDRNFIYGLSISSTNASAVVAGVETDLGTNTFINNIVSLTANINGPLMHGFRDLGGTNNIYFNTVSLSGATTGATADAALFTNNTNTRNIRNNIFSNGRTGGGTHSATNISSSSSLTLGYNNYQGAYSGAGHTGLNVAPDNNSVSGSPAFTSVGGTSAVNYTPTLNSIFGFTITGYSTDYFSASRAGTPTMGAIEISLPLIVDVYSAGVYQKSYINIYQTFNAINNGVHTGSLVTKVTGSTTEPLSTSATLNASGSGSASYSDLTIYPTASNLTISGNVTGPLIYLNSADNVTFDGRINASGSTKDLTITNTNTGAGTTSTFYFIDDAQNNTIKYCTIKGSETTNLSGIIYFSTAVSGTTGNDNNTIEYCNITADAAGRAYNAIYTSGTATKENGNITITNNNIYNVMSNAASSSCINIGGSTDVVTISNNSFYETTTLTGGAGYTYYIIYNGSTSSFNGTITGNYIGGSAANCAGSAFTMNATTLNTFAGINIATGSASIQGNIIRNISWTTNAAGASSFYGINASVVAGKTINIGNISGNTIGSNTSNGSISATNNLSATFSILHGIYTTMSGAGTLNIMNNQVSGITTAGSSTTSGYSIYGIKISGMVASCVATISNNIVGSTSLANSLQASTSSSTCSDQQIKGIQIGGGNATSVATISNNTIANVSNNFDRAGGAYFGFRGIETASTGQYIIANNLIYNASSACGGTSNDVSSANIGIVLTSATAVAQSITGNTIYNLTNSASGNNATKVVGIAFSGSSTANTVSKNYIYNLVDNSTSTTSEINGIRIVAGLTTYSNNIINIGTNNSNIIYGIYENGAAGNNNTLYFNTINIKGTPISGAINSYALYSAVATNIRDFRNNILVNARSNGGTASGKHYAAFFNYAVNTNLTLDYNDYYTPGTGGVLGRYNAADDNAVPLVTGKDAASLAIDPSFTNAALTTQTDFLPTGATNGTTIATITTDYYNNIRSTPKMGALEAATTYKVEVWIGGVLQASYYSLTDAFAQINTGLHSATTIDVKIIAGHALSSSAVLYQSGYGSLSSYTNINVYPTSALTVTGNLSGSPLIDLNGADNVIIDGRINASGSSKDIIYTNTSTSATANTSTIRFINDATTNTVKYCTIKGSETNASSGIILFSTATTTGNDNNTITLNNITGDAAGRPLNAIFALGSAGFANYSCTISSNNIYDFLNASTASQGIYISTDNTTWSVTGNSFYETASPFSPSANVNYYAIRINNSGDGYEITDNFIGGNAASCSGTWTKANTATNFFFAISVTATSTNISSIQNNTITNFSYSNNGIFAFNGIEIAGTTKANVGTITGNTIGSNTGNDAISVIGGPAGQSAIYAIKISSTSEVNVVSNKIGSLTANTSAGADGCWIYCIQKTAVAGTLLINNNLIGSISSSNSIRSNSVCSSYAQHVIGIVSTGTGSITITNNIIGNLSNSNTFTTGNTCGMACSGASSLIITDNQVYNLTAPSLNLYGIQISATSNSVVCSHNTIHDISHSNYAGYTAGIYGNLTGTIERNFIYNISSAGINGAYYCSGIIIGGGSATVQNNIVNITSASSGVLFSGIRDDGGTNVYYYNTAVLSGAGGGTADAALYTSAANSRNIRNNIFSNTRTGAGNHSATNISSNTTLTLGYNDYTGTFNGAGHTGLNVAPDNNSVNTAPNFASYTDGTTPQQFYPSATLTGTAISTIPGDFFGYIRTIPEMGAIEGNPATVLNKVDVLIGGVIQASYPTLTDAYNQINYGTHQGALDVRINSSHALSLTAKLYNSGYGYSSYSSVTTYPNTTGLTVSGNIAGNPLIDLDGADNVTHDGRAGKAGSSKDISYINTSTSNTAGTSTFRFVNDANTNEVKYSYIKGSSVFTTSGVILLSSATSTGNSNITIDNNEITASSAGNPYNIIYSSGTASKLNSDIEISNNNIYNYSASGILLEANSNNWTINDNSIYNTAASSTLTSDYYGINIPAAANCNNLTINNNFIGGRAVSCGGSALTLTSATANINFFPILVSANSGSVTINGNTIKNIAYSQTASGSSACGITCMDLSGTSAYTVGQSGSSNYFGATTGTGSISSSGAAQCDFYGVKFSGTGASSISYNYFGAISQSASVSKINLVQVSSNVVASINNNEFGSSVSNNISNTASAINALVNLTGAGTFTVSDNIFQQVNSTHNSGATFGVQGSAALSLTSNNNQFKDFTLAQPFRAYSISGATASTITNNSITNINLTYGTFDGIYSSASTTITITGNTVNDINLSSTSITIPVFTGITAEGTASITIGNTSNPNIIGSTIGLASATDGITITNNVANATVQGTVSIIKVTGTDGTNPVNVGYNQVGGITMTGTNTSGIFSLVEDLSTTPTTIDNNTLGNSTANNISTGLNGIAYGINCINTANKVKSVTNNVLQNINITNTGTGNPYAVIYFPTGFTGGASAVSINNNTIQNISTVSTFAKASNIWEPVLSGIYFGDPTITNYTSNTSINENYISGLYMNSTSSVASSVTGIYVPFDNTSGGLNYNINFLKNHIYLLENKSTSSSSNIYGIHYRTNGGAGARYVYLQNNAIVLSNGSNTNAVNVYGLYVNTSGATNNYVPEVYHNTVKVSGTSSGTTTAISAHISPGPGTSSIKNNLFQNTRTGGTITANAILNNSTDGTFDYNYIEVSADPNKLVSWGGANKTYATWKTIPQGTNDLTGAITLAANGTVPNATSADVKNNGINTLGVTTDIDGVTRSTGAVTIPCGSCNGPWRGAYENYSPLPVSLIYFNIKCNNNFNQISWQTSSELNSEKFIVYHSLDGEIFNSITEVKSAGNSNEVKQYQYLHKNAKLGKNYYKLRQVDFDGNYTDSKVIVFDARCANLNFSIETVYYNNLDNTLNISIYSLEHEKAYLSLYDITGRTIMATPFSIKKETENYQFKLPELSNGTYLVILTDDGGGRFTQKIIINR